MRCKESITVQSDMGPPSPEGPLFPIKQIVLSLMHTVYLGHSFYNPIVI